MVDQMDATKAFLMAYMMVDMMDIWMVVELAECWEIQMVVS